MEAEELALDDERCVLLLLELTACEDVDDTAELLEFPQP